MKATEEKEVPHKRVFIIVFVRAIQRAWRINLFALSAQLAYYEFLSIFPLLILLVSLLGLFPIDGLVGQGIDLLEPFVPIDIIDFILNWIDGIKLSGGITALIFGLVGLTVTGSATTGALMYAFRIIEREPRKKTLLSILIARLFFSTAAAGVAVLILVLWVVGPSIIKLISLFFKIEQIWNLLWIFLQFPLGIIIVTFCIGIFYNVLGYRRTNLKSKIPGAFIATMLSYILSIGFSFYLAAVPDFNLTYGSLAGIVVFLLWLQLMNLALLFGEVLNVELAV